MTDGHPIHADTVPGLVIAAPRSGGGKTTVTLGLLAAFAKQGVRVQPFKCGPDYIDPAFHAAAAGRASVNLDSWAMRHSTVDRLLAENLPGADIAICEGVMGLFDGVASVGAWGTGATADIAGATGWPVVLVLDVSGQAQTAAAVALGCARLRQDVRIAGVILNKVASERHRRFAAGALEAAGFAVLGALPRRDDLALPERHLGLVQAGETAQLAAKLDAIGAFVAGHVDLTAVRATAAPSRFGSTPHPVPLPKGERTQDAAASVQSSPPLWGEGQGEGLLKAPADPPPAYLRPPGQRIALARDAAFSFMYPHILSAWRDVGAAILPFSPLADEAPDQHADAVWLPGGYPELHAGKLAAAEKFRGGLRQAAAAGKPIHGECGGFMVLGDGLVDAQGQRHAMAGLLRVETSFENRKLHLGYRCAKLVDDCMLGGRGQMIRGHEFHYATLLAQIESPLAVITDAEATAVAETGARRENVTGSFFHMVDAG